MPFKFFFLSKTKRGITLASNYIHINLIYPHCDIIEYNMHEAKMKTDYGQQPLARLNNKSTNLQKTVAEIFRVDTRRYVVG